MWEKEVRIYDTLGVRNNFSWTNKSNISQYETSKINYKDLPCYGV